MSLQLQILGLVLLLIWVSLCPCQNCALYRVSSGQLLMPLWPCCSISEVSLAVFSEKKNNNFHYKFPLKPGFIFLVSSHMLLWLWVKCLQGPWCEALNNIVLNSKEFICITSWVCSSRSSSCTGAIRASQEVVCVKESCLSLSLLEARRCHADGSVARCGTLVSCCHGTREGTHSLGVWMTPISQVPMLDCASAVGRRTYRSW